jgi:hypothetical protein
MRSRATLASNRALIASGNALRESHKLAVDKVIAIPLTRLNLTFVNGILQAERISQTYLGVEDKSEKHGKNGHLVGLDIEQRAQGVPPSLPSADFSSNRGNSSTEPLTHCTSISRSR